MERLYKDAIKIIIKRRNLQRGASIMWTPTPLEEVVARRDMV
jgi:hypothetical protein